MSLNVTVQLNLEPFGSNSFRIIEQKPDRLKEHNGDLFKCQHGRIRLVHSPEFRMDADTTTFYLRGSVAEHKQTDWYLLKNYQNLNMSRHDVLRKFVNLVNTYNQQPEEAGWIRVEAEGLEVWQSP